MRRSPTGTNNRDGPRRQIRTRVGITDEAADARTCRLVRRRRLSPRHHFKLNANGRSKESNSPNCAENSVARTPCNQTLYPCLASVCPSTDDPITDIRGRDGTAFTHGAPVSRRAARREQMSEGRQIREKPVTALTTSASHLSRGPANALQLQLDPTARA